MTDDDVMPPTSRSALDAESDRLAWRLAVDAAGVGVDDLVLRRPTLDDVFLALTGRVAEERAEDEEEQA